MVYTGAHRITTTYCTAHVTLPDSPDTLKLQPIGVIHTPHRERADAPWQPRAAEGIEGRIELYTGHHYEDALADLDGWDHIWVVFWFDRNTNWRPKVRPPRSDRRRGVFSTRSPHRPNPIGLSVLRLDGVDGLNLRVRDVDLLDQTPILDIKPYVPWTDAVVDARTGWLPERAVGGQRPEDAGARYQVVFSDEALEQLEFLASRGVDELRGRIESTLRAGPEPHAYRRIKRLPDGYQLAVKEWRARFDAEGTRITVHRLHCGYRAVERNGRPELGLHREFVDRFG